MHNKDIIITGLQSWDIEIGSNCKNIAMEFAKNNRVLYVNPPLDRLTYFKKSNKTTQKVQAIKSKKIENPIEVLSNLWVYTPTSIIESISRLPYNLLFDVLNKRNNDIFAKDIRKAINKLKFRNYIHFCDNDIYRSFYLKDFLKPDFYIYYSRDNLQAVKYWQAQSKRIEPLHMHKADVVVANSTYLAKLASENNPNSYFVGQGCDLSAFKPQLVTKIPDDIGNIPKPIIGYIGALKTLRLDMGILEHIAKAKPEWSIVLVGPEDENFKASNLHKLSNVFFLGIKKESELPNYLAAFDVAINPQTINEVTIGNYPRKIDEYLAMGKAVVATKTVAMDYFAKYVSLAATNNQWIELIDRELKDDSLIRPNERIAFAKEHSWENSVNEIISRIKLPLLAAS